MNDIKVCYECGEKLKDTYIRFDAGYGNYYYFCDKECLKKFVKNNSNVIKENTNENRG